MAGLRSGRSGAPIPRSAPAGFELLAPAGVGASSAVWLARSVATGATVALKWLVGDGRGGAAGGRPTGGLGAEAEVLASLDHPNIVRALDLVVDPAGEPVLVLEHAGGGSLADAIARRGRLGGEEVARVGAALADALTAVHGLDILHRDVKPTNILFTAEGAPLLADFGVAAGAGGATGAASVGTAEYLDPAVVAGGPPAPSADLYALGITLYEALAGHVPFTGATPEEVLAAADDGRHITLDLASPDAGHRLVTAVERAISRHPRDRQPDAAALAAELRAAAPVRVAPGGRPWDGPAGHHTATSDPEDEGGAPVERHAVAPERPTRTFGPRPPRHTSERQVLRRAAVLAPLAALVVTAAVLVSPVSPLTGGEEASRAATLVATPTAQVCPTIDRGPGFVPADLDLDGCPTALRWDGEVLEVPAGSTVAAARYAIGRPGDTLLFGDWDCDRLVTPALHRSAIGQTVVFDEWAEAGQPLEGRTLEVPTGGEATVRVGSDGCDELHVER